MPPSTRVPVDIDGHILQVSNLDKVLYPIAGTTKAEVIDYYARIAPVLLDHIADRGVTLRRFPNGVDSDGFFEKRCPSHRPDWVATAEGPGDRGGPIRYCRLDSRAALVWSANLAAIELHAPMARCTDVESPTMVVFDFDPGPDVDICGCAEVALLVREVLDSVGLWSAAKTSGSKGLQVYVPVNGAPASEVERVDHDRASRFALAVGQVVEKQHPKRVTTTMAKVQRTGRVFIDWSQNSRHKTTIAPYSLRARAQPSVSTPVSWDEVEMCAGGVPMTFTATDVLARVERLGDLFAGTLDRVQALPPG